MTSPGRRGRVAPALLAALTGTIEDVAATAGPVVEATADAARGGDPVRQQGGWPSPSATWRWR